MSRARPVADQSGGWFLCQNKNCGRWVTALNREAYKHPNAGPYSSTHCCRECRQGLPHDSFWCGGTPAHLFREFQLCGSWREAVCQIAHCVVHVPDWNLVQAPVPALLWLHGALTYIWPESLWPQLQNVLDHNEIARSFVIIAPFGSVGESVAVVSDYRTKPDRFGRERPYVESFHVDNTWQCFLTACHQIGRDRVDFGRLCVTGFSMGAQATWHLAMEHGSRLAAVCPLAGCCHWGSVSEESHELVGEELRALPIRAYHVEADVYSYSWPDFKWLASEVRGLPWETHKPKIIKVSDNKSVPKELNVYQWGDGLDLGLLRPAQGYQLPENTDEHHNCWDLAYQREKEFGLFTWMASSHNPLGLELACLN